MSERKWHFWNDILWIFFILYNNNAKYLRNLFFLYTKNIIWTKLFPNFLILKTRYMGVLRQEACYWGGQRVISTGTFRLPSHNATVLPPPSQRLLITCICRIIILYRPWNVLFLCLFHVYYFQLSINYFQRIFLLELKVVFLDVWQYCFIWEQMRNYNVFFIF